MGVLPLAAAGDAGAAPLRKTNYRAKKDGNMPLGNIVILEEGIPERMHFKNARIEARDITDVQTGQPTVRNALVFDVDEHNGAPARATFSTLAEKLYAKLEPYLKDKAYLNYDFVITKTGKGYRTTFPMMVLPRQK